MTENTTTNISTPHDLQLAACLAAAEGAIDGPYAIGPDSPSWSAAYEATAELRRDRDRMRAELGARQTQTNENARPPTPRVEAAIKHLAEALFEDGFPAEVHIVDRRAKYTVSHALSVGVHTVTVVVGPPAPQTPSHMSVVTKRPIGANGPVEIVAVCETEGAAWALVDEIAAERTGSGRHPLWHARATSYPVRR